MKIKVLEKDFRGLPGLEVSVSTDGIHFEPITTYAYLCILHWIFRSEDCRYKPEDGYEGRRYPLRAIKELGSGFDPETVCKKFKVNKGSYDAVEFIEKPTEERYEEMRGIKSKAEA